MTQSSFSLSRRLFLRKAAQHAPAAAALAVLPVIATSEPAVALDPVKECERLASDLAKAMNTVTQGNWRVTINHQSGFVLICNDAYKDPEPAGHIPADDMLPKYREIRELVDKLEWKDYEPRLLHGDLSITHPRSPQKPERLLGKLRACDPVLVAEYLTITGRVTPTTA